MQTIACFLLKLFGWKIIGSLPKEKKYILIVAPHTSNWDLVIGLCARFAVGEKINFLAKKQVFFFPLGALLRAIGGTAIDRSKHENKVEQVVALYNQQQEFRLGLAPEGTRSEVSRWKEGFYHIACKADLPIAMVGLDYKDKEVRVREAFWPSKDINKDFADILTFFRTIRGKYPKVLPDYTPK
jgi:1-acyl-sn-glycerol-3-phosphate acyltransferase